MLRIKYLDCQSDYHDCIMPFHVRNERYMSCMWFLMLQDEPSPLQVAICPAFRMSMLVTVHELSLRYWSALRQRSLIRVQRLNLFVVAMLVLQMPKDVFLATGFPLLAGSTVDPMRVAYSAGQSLEPKQQRAAEVLAFPAVAKIRHRSS